MKPSEALADHRVACGSLSAATAWQRPRVFGSVLNGSDDVESDLDLQVDPTETTSLFTLAGCKMEAEELLGVPVFSMRTADEISQRGIGAGAARS
jgi:uncharacterized protein